MAEIVALSADRELGEFFDFLYEEVEGYVYSATKNPKTKEWMRYFFEWPYQRQELIDHVTANSRTYEVYTAPSLFREREATKESWLGTNVLWAEFDYGTPDLGQFPGIPHPSARIRSSSESHQHWYWKLDGFVSSSEILESLTRRIAYGLRADLGTWNCNRVLRPPSTIHHESSSRVAEISSSSDKSGTLRVSIADFATLPDPPQGDVEIPDAVPELLEVIALHVWPQRLWDAFKADNSSKGKRSDSLCWIAYECAELGMGNAEVLAVLLNCDERWKKFYGRDDRLEQLTAIVARARLKYPRSTLDDSSALPVIGSWDFVQSDIRIEWIIEGLLPQQSIALLVSPSGIGKTQLSLQMGIHLALGTDFLKFGIAGKTKVMVLSLEMSEPEIHHLLKQMLADKYGNDLVAQQILNDKLVIVPLGRSLKLSKEKAQTQLIEAIEKHRPTGLVVDSLGTSVGDDINNDQVINEVFDFYKRTILSKYKGFVWIVHHFRKSQVGNRKPNKLDDILGSQYIGAHADMVLSLWPKGRDIEVTALKTRMAAPMDPFVITRAEHLSFDIVDGTGLVESIDEQSVSNNDEDGTGIQSSM